MTVTHLIILCVFVPAYCLLLGYLWIGLMRNKILATICYGVMAAFNVATSARLGTGSMITAALGVAMATGLGVLLLRAAGVGKARKRAPVDAKLGGVAN